MGLGEQNRVTIAVSLIVWESLQRERERERERGGVHGVKEMK